MFQYFDYIYNLKYSNIFSKKTHIVENTMIDKILDEIPFENPDEITNKKHKNNDDEWGFYVELDIDTDVGKFIKFTNNINPTNYNIKKTQTHRKKIVPLPKIWEETTSLIKSQISPTKIIGALVLAVLIFSI